MDRGEESRPDADLGEAMETKNEGDNMTQAAEAAGRLKPGDRVIPAGPMIVDHPVDDANSVVRWGGFTFPASLHNSNLAPVASGPIELWGVWSCLAKGYVRFFETEEDVRRYMDVMKPESRAWTARKLIAYQLTPAEE